MPESRGPKVDNPSCMMHPACVDGRPDPRVALSPVADGRLTMPRTLELGVTDVLRRRILTGDLGPGTPLRQAELASELGTSITPVRAALSRLVEEGLVVAQAHTSMSVVDPSADDLREVYEMRLLLEPASIGRATLNFTQEHFGRAEELVAAMESTDDMGVWSSLNRDFHVTLVSACGSSRMTRVVYDLLGLSALQIRRSLGSSVPPSRRASADAEHRAILHAIASRNPEQARREALQHLNSSKPIFTIRPRRPRANAMRETGLPLRVGGQSRSWRTD